MREPPGTLTVEEVDRFLEAASLLGLSSVRFTGGEPLVRKELPEMIARARAKEGWRTWPSRPTASSSPGGQRSSWRRGSTG